jgi:hypothetical protein
MHSVAELERDSTLRLETTGLTLAEGKRILKHVQEVIVEEQVRACLIQHRHRTPPKATIRSDYRRFSAIFRSKAHVFDVAPAARQIK